MAAGGASYQSAMATNRCGLGARPQDQPGAAPQSWVLGGIAAYRPRPPAIDALEPSDALARRFFEAQHLFRQRRQSMAAEAAGPNPASALADQAYAAQLQVRIALAVEEPTPSVERLVHFWANHFRSEEHTSELQSLMR